MADSVNDLDVIQARVNADWHGSMNLARTDVLALVAEVVALREAVARVEALCGDEDSRLYATREPAVLVSDVRAALAQPDRRDDTDTPLDEQRKRAYSPRNEISERWEPR